jgi:hypothetical protein
VGSMQARKGPVCSKMLHQVAIGRGLCAALLALLGASASTARAESAFPTPPIAQGPAIAFDPFEHERLLQGRLDALAREEHALTRAGRPAYYTRRRVLGFAALGVGGALTLSALCYAMLYLAPLPHTRGTNVHQARIDDVVAERRSTARELKQARRARKRRAKYGVVPEYSFSERRFTLSLAVHL